ncbi:hypothetical protein [Halalkalibacterium halodurans]|uniref:hypothetical protein n=1 Tax=Halalkalibacterium halodurans TaxID=86665 RepID=UPI00141964EA|nr:hypothetical protein [Halalkalibacterium halodurans]
MGEKNGSLFLIVLAVMLFGVLGVALGGDNGWFSQTVDTVFKGITDTIRNVF